MTTSDQCSLLSEFAGDLTLCISYREAVLSYRIRQQHDSRRFTVDNEQTFDEVKTFQYRFVVNIIFVLSLC